MARRPETWWDEEARRLNAMGRAVRALGVTVDVGETTPKLNPDGSLEDEIQAELAANVFCPTGAGGGVKPTCKKGGTITTKRGEVLVEAVRGPDKKWMIGDQEAPDHIQKLAIPPSWKDVYINPDPKGTLWAKGTDEAGRSQPKYSDSHKSEAAAAKWGRVSELRSKRAEIFKEIEKDTKKTATKEEAECLKVVMQTGIRPGSTQDTKAEFESFGATTLLGRHVVTNKNGNVSLKFVAGKSKGQSKEYPIHDESTAKMLKQRAKASGADGSLFATDANSLRAYSKDTDGGGFKTKDHRTALGTETAIAEINRMGAVKKFSSFKEYKASVKQVGEKVSSTLGNTVAVAIADYIDPSVWTGWSSPPAPIKKARSK